MKKTTTRFEHRLRKPFSYEYYSKGQLSTGRVVLKSKTPDKPEGGYKFILGHGANLLIPSDFVEVYRITRTVEEIEEKA